MFPRACAETSDPQRRFFCRHYENCLDLAARSRWPGFTCASCRDCAPAEIDPAAAQDDEYSCRGLLLCLFYPELFAGQVLSEVLEFIAMDRKAELEPALAGF